MWLALLCVLLAAGCGEAEVEVRLDEHAQQAFAAVPGTIGIRIETLEEQHLFALAGGVVSRVRDLPKPQKGAAAVGAGFLGPETLPASATYDYRPPYLVSPDGALMAVVVVPKGRPEPLKYTTLAIVRTATGEIAMLIEGEERQRIRGVAWSGDSRRIAILRGSSKRSMGPEGILASLSGHAVLLTTYFLEIFDASGEEIAGTRLASNVRASWGSIVWFDEAANGGAEEGSR
jgi:hypothetical protein